jgi:hypothetical protein
MLQLAETDGPQVALEYAKNQLEQQQQQQELPSSRSHHISTMSSWRHMMELDGPTSPRRCTRRTIATVTTASTLHPPSCPMYRKICPWCQVEKQLLPYFQEAALFVPFQFTSSLATYVVRRPYGNSTAPALFAALSSTPVDDYRKRAHVTDLIGIGSQRDDCQGPVVLVVV